MSDEIIDNLNVLEQQFVGLFAQIAQQYGMSAALQVTDPNSKFYMYSKSCTASGSRKCQPNEQTVHYGAMFYLPHSDHLLYVLSSHAFPC